MVGMRCPYGGSYNNGSESQPLGGAAAAAPEVPAMEVHKVVPPPPQSTASKLKARVKETLFPDDPFRGFKGQPPRVQWLLAVKYLFPILDWLPAYSFSLFKSDLIAGLTIASLAIPQA
jgi:sulfate transporter 3